MAAAHRRWWWQLIRRLAPRNLIVQPANRGTAIGILLQLLHLERINPSAEVVLLPSDHLVIDEAVLAAAVRRALRRVRAAPAQIVLLGMTPIGPDPELGYIVPAPPDQQGISEVLRFVEKPAPATAARLIERGGLLNAFILAARCSTLLELLTRAQPDIVRELRDALDARRDREEALQELYQRLPAVDFSQQVLELAPPGALQVASVDECGWSDLGTPERIGQAISMLAHGGRSRAGFSDRSEGRVDLSARYLHSLLAAARELRASA